MPFELTLVSLDALHTAVDGASYVTVAFVVGVAFSSLYLGYAGLALLMTRRVLPAWGVGQLIEPRALAPGQVQNEIRHSLVSIGIFTGYGVVMVAAERHDWVTMDWSPSLPSIGVNLIVLIIWNEIHFYACHRLLHTRWLYRRVHVVHHRSVVPTPFTTFSFHWVEATMLSSVMLLLLCVWPLDIVTVSLFPAISLIANSIGHMNYAVFPRKRPSELFAACQRHTAHHAMERQLRVLPSLAGSVAEDSVAAA